MNWVRSILARRPSLDLVGFSFFFVYLTTDLNTTTGFWLTFVSLLLLILAGCTVCFGRRRDRMAGATSNSYQLNGPKGGFLSRFRRN